jgi:accessory gene regulator B
MEMVDKLSVKLASFLCSGVYESEKDRARVQYGLNILLSEGLKFIFLILFFTALRYEKYFYFSLLILLSTRAFAGGIHVNGTLSCLVLTTLLFLSTSVIAPQVPSLPSAYYYLIGPACVAATLLRAPVCSNQRPMKDRKTKMKYKLAAVFFTALWAAVLLLFSSTPYVNCGFSTLLLQSMQLVLVKKPKE